MMLRAGVLAAAVAALLLAGCGAEMQRSGSTGVAAISCPNSSAACDVAVGVYCPPNPQAKCLVSVDANVVEMKTSAGANKVTWRLPAGGDWQVPVAGSVFAGGAPFNGRGNGPFIYECTPASTQAGEWKYKVVVSPRGISRSADPLDPWVVTN